MLRSFPPSLFPVKVAPDSWICVSRSVVKYIGSTRLNDSACSQSQRSIFKLKPISHRIWWTGRVSSESFGVINNVLMGHLG